MDLCDFKVFNLSIFLEFFIRHQSQWHLFNFHQFLSFLKRQDTVYCKFLIDFIQFNHQVYNFSSYL